MAVQNSTNSITSIVAAFALLALPCGNVMAGTLQRAGVQRYVLTPGAAPSSDGRAGHASAARVPVQAAQQKKLLAESQPHVVGSVPTD
jgi:hypothetical protein